MQLKDLSEDRIIRKYFQPMAGDLSDDVASLLVEPGQLLLVSTDALVEGIHFLRESAPVLVGEKAARVNASDIVASGGTPLWVTMSISMPRELDVEWLAGFAKGFQNALDDLGLLLVGGDTTASLDKIAISITVLGKVAPSERIGRRGAKAGDWIGVTGSLGEAALGLDYLLGRRSLDEPHAAGWIKRHFIPPNRLDFARAMAQSGLLHAMMDLSDGLATDLPRLCLVSGVGAELELERIPISPAGRESGILPEAALYGGEDYELLLTVAPENWEALALLAKKMAVPLTRVGWIREGNEVGLISRGMSRVLSEAEFKHFG